MFLASEQHIVAYKVLHSLAGETNIKVFKNDATCGIPADRQTIKDNFNSI